MPIVISIVMSRVKVGNLQSFLDRWPATQKWAGTRIYLKGAIKCESFYWLKTEELLKTKELSLTFLSLESFVVMFDQIFNSTTTSHVNFDIAAQNLYASLPCLYL